MYDIEKTWPKWKIIRTIGEGSFGKVFEIERNEYGIEEHSALKVISIPKSVSEIQALKNDGMTDADSTAYFRGIVGDFVQEIRLMSKLKGNPHIVTYEDFDVIEKNDSIGFEILIRMELLTEFSVCFGKRRFSVYDVLKLGIDMCKALESCRDFNIIHRDIKPENIFMSSNGDYKLGDFGIARTVEKTMVGLSRKGTYSYMAPEIYNGNKYGFETDIYSLGLVLYKLLNNNRDPFLPNPPAPVMYSDKMEAMLKRMQGEPLPLPANTDEVLSKIILKACAHNPAERYVHPREFRLALEKIADNYRSVIVEVARAESEQSQDTILLDENMEVPSVEKEKECIPLICPACKKEMKEGALFCGFCGHRLSQIDARPEVSKTCSNCGCEVKLEAKFCGKCGNKLS